MNRRTSTKVLVVILVSIALSTTTANALPCSYDICVNQSGWWPTDGAFNVTNTPIQLAINNATAGDTIYVYNDTYNENVDISTASLTLKGEGRDVVTVKSTANHVFHVTASYVNISGFNVTGADGVWKAGIYLNGVSHCNISNNTALNNYYGIYLDSSSSNSLTNNTVSGNAHHGIYLYSSSNNNNISNNTVNSNSYRGIELYSSSNNNITCNWLWNNTDNGFRLSIGSIGNNISCNNIIANGAMQPNGSSQWQFYNNQDDIVEAKNNYWGAGMNNSTIDASIYDDEEGMGEVEFYPFETMRVPCAPIPELTTVVLISLGLLALAGYYRIRRKA